MSSFRIRFRSFSASTNDSYMKFVNENWSTQKNRREQRFFLNAYFFCREFCWFFWNDPLASPHTGNTHFYLFRSHGLRARWEVSMPSHGQHSFLRKCRDSIWANQGRCQCPHTGNTHFYRMMNSLMVNSTKSVNALTRATPISTMAMSVILKVAS